MATASPLGTEVRYITAEGTDVVTSLAEVDAERVVRGLPVRDVRSYAREVFSGADATVERRATVKVTDACVEEDHHERSV